MATGKQNDTNTTNATSKATGVPAGDARNEPGSQTASTGRPASMPERERAGQQGADRSQRDEQAGRDDTVELREFRTGGKPEVGQRVRVFTANGTVGSENQGDITAVRGEHPDGGYLVDISTNPDGGERERLTNVRLMDTDEDPQMRDGSVAYPIRGDDAGNDEQ